MKVTVDEAMTLATRLLEGTGLAADKARETARVLVLAEHWGIGSHGFLRLPIYLDRTKAGGFPADAELVTVLDTGPLLTLNGSGGMGHWQMTRATREAVDRAGRFGVSAVAVGNSGHCGALGVYAADAASSGMVGLVFSCGPAVLPAWGGTRPLLSTSPLAAGIPLAGGPVIVDMALSTVARGKIAAYAREGKALPDGWALDSEGTPTNDAQAALTGLLAPLGGAKGFALAFMVEALTAGLVGPLLSADVPDFFSKESQDQPQSIAHLLVVLDPSKLDAGGDPDAAAQRLLDLAERTRDMGGRVPGSKRTSVDDLSGTDLLDMPDELWSELQHRSSEVDSS
ncbi:Ldh family oxidoreductase [Nocardioides sp. LHG3406-4]|uniref:Ldh family oxidoreductase n=1 Tax=Nocardioides sp. LHG3406-4 TaxID=2804575 RepID=UPI003CF574E9